MNAFDASNPLTLTQIVTGLEPDIASFELPLSYTALTNIGMVSFAIDGTEPPLYSVTAQTNGNCLVEWNTTYSLPGGHVTSASLSIFGASGGGGDTPDPTVLSASGPPVPCQVTNILTFDLFYAEYSSYDWLYAQLAVPNASYTISLYDASTNLLRTITGSTTGGQIHEYWDGKDSSGNPYSSPSALAKFDVTPDGGEPETHWQILNQQLGVPDGTFSIACGFDSDPASAYTAFRNAIDFGVVNDLLAGVELFASQGPDYPSYLDNPYTDQSIGRDGYWATQQDVTNLLTHLGFDNGEDCKNFFFEGHGSETWLSNVPSTNGYQMSVIQLKKVTRNRVVGNGADNHYARPHPYRFVFLDACDTATAHDWALAFGVLPVTYTFSEVQDKPENVQAFVGWNGEPRCPASSDEWNAFGDTLDYIMVNWMGGYPLDVILQNASESDPYGDGSLILDFPLGKKHSYLKQLFNKGNINNFHYVIYGYPGITRTGFY